MTHRIALSMRAVEAPETGEVQSALAMDWVHWLESVGMVPVLVPNGLRDPLSYLDALAPDLVVLTGGGERGQSSERDRVEELFLQRAIQTATPLLGVCRGLQVLNERTGGHQRSITGHTAVMHGVEIEPGWQNIYGSRATVNSYHDLGIAADALSDDLLVAARDETGNVEAAYHKTHPIAGIMWHPEREGAPAADHKLINILIKDGAFWR
jgi:N5-(cytidine 5'-diphosphoramidyl)-L-glutamine hydrolase